MRDFTAKTAAITGAGSGIGRALALELADRGAHVALSDIDVGAAESTAELCARSGSKARAYRLDVADRAAVYAHAEEVVADYGAVHLVVNNAGVGLVAEVESLSWDDFDWLMGINFWGVMHGTKAFLPHLIASGDGHLVNVSSIFGIVAVAGQSSYNAAKFGVRGFTEALRQEMLAAGHPVGVSCVHPGGIKTNIARSTRISSDVDRRELVQRFEKVARTSAAGAARVIIRGVERNSPRVFVGADAHVLNVVHRLLGVRYQSVLAAANKLLTR